MRYIFQPPEDNLEGLLQWPAARQTERTTLPLTRCSASGWRVGAKSLGRQAAQFVLV